jgi:hypothetical protein
MRGQWRGRFTGYSTGEITLEIDEYDKHYDGRACVFERNNESFVYVLEFKTSNKQAIQEISLPILFQNIGDTARVSQSQINQLYPNTTFPNRADVILTLGSKGLRIRVTTYAGPQRLGILTAFLTGGSADKRSKIRADKKVTTWEKFKVMVGKLPSDKYIFRGQPVPNRLRTSFHRTNRRNLEPISKQRHPSDAQRSYF